MLLFGLNMWICGEKWEHALSVLLPVWKGMLPTSFECHQTAVRPVYKPRARKFYVFCYFVRYSFEFITVSVWFHSAAPCQKQTEPPWDLGKKSTMSHTVDLIRITRLVHRSSARNCNLRRLSGRGRIHCVGPTSRHLKTINRTTHRAFVLTTEVCFVDLSSCTYSLLRWGTAGRGGGGSWGHGETREFPASRTASLLVTGRS